MKLQITQAIENRRLIEFIYDGGRRVVEPHCFGKNSKGNEIVRAFQIDGYSSTGKMGWKLYDLAKVLSLTILEEVFLNSRPDYMKGDKGMTIIYCEL